MTVQQRIGLPSRPETGAMQFGEDWPGIFIRGDRAIFAASVFRKAAETPDEPWVATMLKEWADMLETCKVES